MIGLGKMGSGMAVRLAAAGIEVKSTDPLPWRSHRLTFTGMSETRILEPWFGDVSLWRDVSRQNQAIGRIGFLVASTATWLPQILNDAGFFLSNSEVKRNRPELWRDAVDGEIIKIGSALVRISLCNGFLDVEPGEGEDRSGC